MTGDIAQQPCVHPKTFIKDNPLQDSAPPFEIVPIENAGVPMPEAEVTLVLRNISPSGSSVRDAGPFTGTGVFGTHVRPLSVLI
jgi:hypothetical protein